MKEFIEKLIGRLMKDKRIGRMSFEATVEIVNQLAEEYNGNDNVMQFVKLLKEICCKEDADYDKAIISPKFLCDTVDTLVMDFVPQNNGWIPCSERLPEETECYFVTWRDRATCKCYVEITEYDASSQEWLDCICQAGLLGYDIIAWQPLPAPYQPKGE